MRIRTLVAALLVLASGVALAHDFTAGSLSIAHPWARATPPGASVGAGYLAITNTGTTEDRLLRIETDISPDALIHETVIENGISRMDPMTDGLVVPAGQTVTLEPIGMHIMFEDLRAPLVAGETIAAVLVFEVAGEVEVVFNIEPIGAAEPAAPHHEE